MIALAFLLGTLLAGSLALNAWLTIGRIQQADRDGDIRVAQVATEAEDERTKYELDVTKKALVAANMRAAALEEELKHALEQSNLGAGLAPADVGGRVLRIVGKWSEAAAARDPLSAEPEHAVPGEPAAGSPGPVVRPSDV